MAAGLLIVTVADIALGVQAWAGSSEPDPMRLTTSAPTEGPCPKPNDGFFTSSWNEEHQTSAWLDHLRGPSSDRRDTRELWLLAPSPSSRLYVIDSLDAYRALADAYPKRWSPPVRNPTYAPDWHEMASRSQPLPFVGIHATAAAVESVKADSQAPDAGFYGWDVESTLWLTWSFDEFRSLGPLDDDWRVRHG